MLAKMILQAVVAAAMIAGAAAVYAATVPPSQADAAPPPPLQQPSPPKPDTGYFDPADRHVAKSLRKRDEHERRERGEREGRRHDDD